MNESGNYYRRKLYRKFKPFLKNDFLLFHYIQTFTDDALENYSEDELFEMTKDTISQKSPAYTLIKDEGDEHGRFHIHCILALPIRLYESGIYAIILNDFGSKYGSYTIKCLDSLEYKENCLKYVALKKNLW